MIEPSEDVLVTREQRGQIAILTNGLCWQLAQKPALFEVAEHSVPSRIAEALAHVGRAGRASSSSSSQTVRRGA